MWLEICIKLLFSHDWFHILIYFYLTNATAVILSCVLQVPDINLSHLQLMLTWFRCCLPHLCTKMLIFSFIRMVDRFTERCAETITFDLEIPLSSWFLFTCSLFCKMKALTFVYWRYWLFCKWMFWISRAS